MWLGLNGLGVQALLTAMVIQFVASLIATTVASVAPEISSSIHFDNSFMGFYTACVYTGSCISTLVGGNFIRRDGPARIAEYGLFVCAISLFLCISDMAAIIIGSGLLLGLAKGPLMPASNTMVSHNTPKPHLNFVFSIKQTSGPLGIALGGLTIPYLAVHYGWRIALSAAAILGLIGAIWCLLVRRDQDTYTDKSEPINFKSLQESFRIVVSTGALLQLSIVSIFYKGISVAIVAYMVTFLVHKQYSLQFGGLALSCLTIGIVFGRLVMGWLADMFHASKIILAFCGLLMGGMAILLAQIEPGFSKPIILCIAFFMGFFDEGWAGVFFAQISLHSPQGRVAEALGGADFFMFMGAIFIPMIFGLLSTHLGNDFQIPFYIFAGTTILTGFFVFFLKGVKASDQNTSHNMPGRGNVTS